MRIGELAERGGVTVRTIRYYIEQGLLPMPPTRGKYGEFDDSYLQRLQLIRQLKKERLTLSAIRDRLVQMGLAPSPPPTYLTFPSPGAAGAEEGAPAVGAFGRTLPGMGDEGKEGLFRSRFADEAGLNSEQVARLEALGLLESSEGLLPPDALPLARAVAHLLAGGATMEDIAEIASQARQETSMHQRLLSRSGSTDPLSRALRWQEQMGAVSTIRQMLLRRWSYSDREKPR